MSKTTSRKLRAGAAVAGIAALGATAFGGTAFAAPTPNLNDQDATPGDAQDAGLPPEAENSLSDAGNRSSDPERVEMDPLMTFEMPSFETATAGPEFPGSDDSPSFFNENNGDRSDDFDYDSDDYEPDEACRGGETPYLDYNGDVSTDGERDRDSDRYVEGGCGDVDDVEDYDYDRSSDDGEDSDGEDSDGEDSDDEDSDDEDSEDTGGFDGMSFGTSHDSGFDRDDEDNDDCSDEQSNDEDDGESFDGGGTFQNPFQDECNDLFSTGGFDSPEGFSPDDFSMSSANVDSDDGGSDSAMGMVDFQEMTEKFSSDPQNAFSGHEFSS